MNRFYDEVAVQKADDGWQVMLDGRGIKTIKSAKQIVPSLALAEALASEWADQEEKLDMTQFVMRDQTDFAIDMVASDPADTIEKLITYAETDTLCYRADPEDALFQRQHQVWDPILGALEAREGIVFKRASGVIAVTQPEATLKMLRTSLAKRDPFDLAGLLTLTSLTASIVIGLEAMQADADEEALWDAANLEELWQIELWGADTEAEAVRNKKHKEFNQALRWLRLAQNA